MNKIILHMYDIMQRCCHRMLCVIIILCATCASARDFVLIVDAGHGGHDSGALGAKSAEKDINLAVATKLADAVRKRLDHVKVVMTRDDDTFISLKERGEIANRNHGDLFISIHVNSVARKARNRLTIEGAQVYTLGLHKTDAALSVAQRENSVMMLESDYSTSYMGFDPESPESNIIFELSHNKHMEQSVELADAIERNLVSTAGRADKGVRQAGFWVLWAASMPSVLVELDFITNPESERFITSDEGQEKMATAICDAVETYLSKYGPQILGTSAPVRPKSKPVPKPSVKNAPGDSPSVYKVQIMVSEDVYKKGDRRFRGLKDVEHYTEDGLVKYTWGTASTLEEANELMLKAQEKFPDAFVVEFRDGKRVH